MNPNIEVAVLEAIAEIALVVWGLAPPDGQKRIGKKMDALIAAMQNANQLPLD